MSTKAARTTALAALTLACAASGPSAWAQGKQTDHRATDNGRSSASHSQSSQGSSSHAAGQAATHDSTANSADGEHNPPGNNGTVKVHQLAGDTSPHNVPHVTCDFYLTFFGFDTDQTADISLAGQAPTGKDVALWSLDDATISTDDAGGGKDVDQEFHVTAADLGLDRLGAPHPKQGFHIKLSVAVNEAPGGEKHKVFWVEPCAAAPEVSGETGGVSGNTSNVGSGAVGGLNENTGGVAGVIEDKAPTAHVLGETFTRGTSGGVLGESTGLPFTGAPLIGLLGAAGLAGLAGAGLVRAGRRREQLG
jgi:hypothetical protein